MADPDSSTRPSAKDALSLLGIDADALLQRTHDAPLTTGIPQAFPAPTPDSTSQSDEDDASNVLGCASPKTAVTKSGERTNNEQPKDDRPSPVVSTPNAEKVQPARNTHFKKAAVMCTGLVIAGTITWFALQRDKAPKVGASTEKQAVIPNGLDTTRAINNGNVQSDRREAKKRISKTTASANSNVVSNYYAKAAPFESSIADAESAYRETLDMHNKGDERYFERFHYPLTCFYGHAIPVTREEMIYARKTRRFSRGIATVRNVKLTPLKTDINEVEFLEKAERWDDTSRSFHFGFERLVKLKYVGGRWLVAAEASPSATPPCFAESSAGHSRSENIQNTKGIQSLAIRMRRAVNARDFASFFKNIHPQQRDRIRRDKAFAKQLISWVLLDLSIGKAVDIMGRNGRLVTASLKVKGKVIKRQMRAVADKDRWFLWDLGE